MTQLILLDRDGVINIDPGYIAQPQHWQAITGSLEAIAQLNQAGYTVVVATNQSGIGRGKFSHADLAKVHEKMRADLRQVGGRVDQIFYCPHVPTEHCACRKPKIGLFEQISQYYGKSLQGVPLIGDKLSDLQAAMNFGGRAILVRTGYGQNTLELLRDPIYRHLQAHTQVVDDLAAAVHWLLQRP